MSKKKFFPSPLLLSAQPTPFSPPLFLFPAAQTTQPAQQAQATSPLPLSLSLSLTHRPTCRCRPLPPAPFLFRHRAPLPPGTPVPRAPELPFPFSLRSIDGRIGPRCAHFFPARKSRGNHCRDCRPSSSPSLPRSRLHQPLPPSIKPAPEPSTLPFPPHTDASRSAAPRRRYQAPLPSAATVDPPPCRASSPLVRHRS